MGANEVKGIRPAGSAKAPGVSLLGCIAGWGLAAVFGHVLSGMLYGVSPSDIATLLAVVLLVMVVAAVASLVPAIRAARVEHMQVLRDE